MQNGKSKHVTIEGIDAPAPTKCAHCSHVFPLAVPIVGAPKDAEFFQMCGLIATHLMNKHVEVAKGIIQRQAEVGFAISGLMALEHVESSDVGLSKWRDQSRHRLHEFTTKNRISDATIELKVRELDYKNETLPDDIIQLVKDVRDILEEKGLYPLDAQTVVLAH